MQQLKDIDLPLSLEEQARLNAAARAWLDRRDPLAQELTSVVEQATEAQQAKREEYRRRWIEHNAEMIRRQWLAAGLEPKPYSLSLAKLEHARHAETSTGA
jgi:hypothetical protein